MPTVDYEIQTRLRAYFGARLDAYGDDPRGVDWQSATAQYARFDALVAIGDLHDATLLDAGCGLGHLYGYLDDRGVNARYTGCDLSEAHIRVAQQAYPRARFVAGDARELAMAETFDYAVACGLLHLRVPRWQRWAWGLVRALYACCRRGFAFTLPRRGFDHPPVLAAIDPTDWAARLRTLCLDVTATTLAPWGDVAFLMRKGPGACAS